MPDGFLSQLRKRKTLRVAAAYLAAAFVSLQAADLLLTAFGGSPRLLAWLVVLGALGFPVALFVGWYVRRTGDRLEWESIPATRSQHLLFACVVVLATGFMGFASWGVWLRQAAPVVEPGADTLLNPARVAVLYLDDHTPGAQGTSLTDGLTEGLIHELSQIPTLEVVSRNGVKPFRQQTIPLDSVVRTLSAGHIVEGSVQQSGDRVRVTVQLIDGATLAHVGSTTIERPYSELFALQDTILAEVSRFLRSRLGDQIRTTTSRLRASNVEAWTFYHRALRLRDEAVIIATSNIDAAKSYFSDAAALARLAEQADPRWAGPIVLRARLAYDESRAIASADPGRTIALINQAVIEATRALAKDSLDAETLEVRGTAAYWGYLFGAWEDSTEAMLAKAAGDLQQAVRRDPRVAAAWATLSHYYGNTGTVQQAYDAAIRAYAADAFLENAPTVLWRLYTFAHDLRRADEATKWCDEGSRRFPDSFRFTECRLWNLTLSDVKPDPTAAWQHYTVFVQQVSGTRAKADSLRMLAVVGIVLGRAGLADSARAVLQKVEIDWTDPFESDIGLWRAVGHVIIGDYEDAAAYSYQYLSAVPGAALTFYGDEQLLRVKDHPAFQRVNRLIASLKQ
jgi:TolB-like protein